MENNIQNDNVFKLLQSAKKEVGVSEKNNEYFKHTQKREEPWCANFLSSIFEKTFGDVPYGYRGKKNYVNQVSKIKEWGEKNDKFVAAGSAEELKSQLSSIKPGDIIVWKRTIEIPTETYSGEVFQTINKSHVGIVSDVNAKNNTIKVIEGNANEYKRNKLGQVMIEERNFTLDNGRDFKSVDFAQTNQYDGVMEKEYTPEKLIEEGYSGYIDMQDSIRQLEPKKKK